MSDESVVFIVHGFRSDSSSVGQLAKVIATKHRVFSVDIGITFNTLEECVDLLRVIVLDELQNAPIRRISFVAHSTGGIVVRMLLNMNDIADKTAACVFVAVPNRGTVLADLHQVLPEPLKGIHKPVSQLTRSFLGTLELKCPDHVMSGGIAGLKTMSKTRFAFAEPNDGVVAVSSVYLCDMVDFIEVPCDHFTIIKDFAVAKAILHFLKAFSFPSQLKSKTK